MVARAVPQPVLDIVTNDGPNIHPGTGNPATGADYANSADVLDTSGIIGIGQMIAFNQTSNTGASIGLCTATLINPRTVITAAHCVYTKPKEYYGSNTGVGGGLVAGTVVGNTYGATNGTPISIGFSPTNRCLGVAANGCAVGSGPYEIWRNSHFTTNTAAAIYNGNQVWYGRNSQPVALGGGGEFGNEDIAVITLDTHVSGIPTWTLLFSPLDGPTHATITGYGAAGVGTTGIGDLAGIDYRRRSAENMIDGLFSSADWFHTSAIGGPGGYNGFDNEAHSLYWLDFDDPAYDPANPEPAPDSAFLPENSAKDPTEVNWNQNNLGGGALPHEGTTAGGDSGGPLIVDQKFDRPVVAGVLTGGWSSNGGIGTYGENSVYPPLFLYWQEIVANNPYKYVSAKAGNGDWFDPAHWVQDMDPNYVIADANGNLVNTLPNVAQLTPDSAAGRWGTSCFFEEDCEDVPGTPYPTGSGPYVYTSGGPGTTNFVPNNIEPVNSLTAALYKQAKYYDVTLDKAGRTTLGASATIDKLTISGNAQLNITAPGNLKVWADYTQSGGWTNIDGKLTTGEAVAIDGIVSGKGTFDPAYLTVVGAAVAPGGGDKVGTFTVQANTIMASASSLFIDAQRGSADKLVVTADSDGSGVLALNGGNIVFNKVTDGPAPKQNESYVIAQAAGGITGTFGQAFTFQGVLRPELTYGTNTITATLRAGKFVTILGDSSPTALAFANALDTMRSGFYDKLANFYGNIDWMNPTQLAATFNAISPGNLVNETHLLQDRQSRQLFGNVTDRLSMIGTGQAKGISFMGDAAGLAKNRNGLSASAQLGLTTGSQTISAPMGKLSGFVTMSNDHVASSYGDSRSSLDQGQHNRYFASGLEAPFGDVTIGSAVGYADSISQISSDTAKSKLTQAAAYASMPLGKSAYVGGVVAAELASTNTNRLSTDTMSTLSLSGATHSSRYMATVEAGFRTGLLKGLSLNPRVQVGYSRYALGGFTENGGDAALALNDLKVNRLETRIGARLDGTTHIAGWTVRPQLQGDYVRLLSGAKNGLSVSFAAAPDYSFLLPLTGSGSGWLEAKGGVELTKGAFRLGLSGQATVGNAPISDQRGLVELGFSF